MVLFSKWVAKANGFVPQPYRSIVQSNKIGETSLTPG